MNIQKYSYIISCLLLFSACRKEELPITAHDPGNVITATVNMEANYKWQIFYDLKTNSIVSKNLKTSWDLGFETGAEGYHVILNSAKVMMAFDTKQSRFEDVRDTAGLYKQRKWDAPCGAIDSTAIGDWQLINHTYIIDRGYAETGTHQGFRKIQLLSADANKYVIRFANINGTGDQTIQIEKDNKYNFMFFSFSTNQLASVEPPKNKWDLEFTQYTHIFYNPLTTYLVTGCLLNRYHTQAATDVISDFSSIGYNKVSAYQLSSYINVIGYDWKTYTGGTYIINTKLNYIIRSREDIYYKLHFIDFFNSNGLKGNPKWEYQEL